MRGFLLSLVATILLATIVVASPPCKGPDGKEVVCPMVLTHEEQLELDNLHLRSQVIEAQLQALRLQLTADASNFAGKVTTTHARADMILSLETWQFIPKPSEKVTDAGTNKK